MIKETDVKTILIRNKRPSMWFGVNYNINIYRGCQHRCIYCDSRSECYKAENFDTDIIIKKNAVELLKKELSSKKSKGTIGFGSMSDPYIPIEKHYCLTRKVLEVIKTYRYPLFLLTKSNLVIRDLDLISEINQQNYACVAFTITTTNDALAKLIEPKAPLPSKRLEALSILSSMGIKVGIVIMPTLPFITDTKENIKDIIEKGKKAGAEFIYPSFGVTLRDRQRQYFYQQLNIMAPSLVQKYKTTYNESYMCYTKKYKELKNYFNELCKENNISTEMPSYDKENGKIQLNLFNDNI